MCVRRQLLLCTTAALLVAALCLDEEMAELARMLRESCAEESGVELRLVEEVNAGAALPPDAKLKCYIKCVMETAGMMSAGAVDVEAVVAMLPDDMRAKTEGSLRACGSRAGADDCDTAYRTQLCWQQANPADYFLI
ncbi:Pheromone-binding protein-related protein 1 [Papilio xuthus]|uniref:Pheromone-binding protein-related protein 1 n=1 Tax=Papilio xuthus TaxID=66420 RepID=A0A0N1IMW7_PAPXU|nr:Pheromone-binding protein-related protein 1 [Papilio xuthus]